VTANYSIYRAKERLTEVSKKHGFDVVFFDGRGGPPARGGGNTHKFYRSFGNRIDSHEIHLTVQGQTISSKYGTIPAARHNLEQLVSAGLENNLFPENCYDLTEHDRSVMDEFSSVANDAYQKLKGHPRFLSYLEHMTPLSYYGQTNIGSRPARRSRSKELSLDDLRAIPFVGAWSQMKQNVPGYYGLGSAIQRFVRNGQIDELRRLYGNSLFFRTLIENAMQSLSKASFPLTYYLRRDPDYGDFWKMLYDEMQLSVRGIQETANVASLLDNEPVTRESIRMREDIVLPLQVIQQFALACIRDIDAGTEPPGGGWHYRTAEGAPETAEVRTLLSKLVLKSLAPSVNASRNAV
jgi:phosphoenolpyruvate carboxylase